MQISKTHIEIIDRESGMTMVELLVALAIGSFLILGAVQIYNQSRQAYIVNESLSEVQSTAQFAMDTIEADLRMASNWGQTSRSLSIENRAVIGDDNPGGLVNIPGTCGIAWVTDLGTPVDGSNNGYALPCGANNGAQASSDVLTVRRATVAPAPALVAGRMQIQSTRVQGQLFDTGVIPGVFDPTPCPAPPPNQNTCSMTHNLMVSSYYISADSDLIPGVPTLRRKVLRTNGAGASVVVDEEIAPGVQNLQVQFGVDVNDDNTVDRYVNPGSQVYDPNAGGYIPGARVMTARVWLVVRGIRQEVGIRDLVNYNPGDVVLGVYNDELRRTQVSKTILLRNSRT